MMRKWVWIGCSLVLMVVLMAIVSFGIASSEAGSAWLIKRVAGRVFTGVYHIENIEGSLFSGVRIDAVRHAAGSWQVEARNISVQSAPLSLLTGSLRIDSIDIEAVDVRLPEEAPPTGGDNVKGAVGINPLPLPVAVRHTHIATLGATMSGLRREMHDLDGVIRLAGRRLIVEELAGRYDRVGFGFTGELELSDPIRCAGTVRWRTPLTPGFDSAGAVDIKGTIDQMTLNVTVSDPFFLSTSGTLHWDSGQIIFSGEPGADRKAGDRKESLRSSDMASSDSALVFLIDRLRADTLRGKIDVDGQVIWHTEPQWSLTVLADHIDPGSRFPAWPGSLAVEAMIDGRLTKGAVALTIPKFKLSGRLLNQPIHAQGRVDTTGQRLASADVKIVSGENSMTIDVKSSAASDAVLTFSIIDPHSLWPPFKGAFAGTTTVTNIYGEPRIELRMEGTQINYVLADAEWVDVSADAVLGDSLSFSAKVDVANLQLKDAFYPLLSVLASGDATKLRLSGGIQAEESRFDFKLSGVSTDNQWEMTAESASLVTTEGGSWKLQAPLVVRLAPDRATPVEACWEKAQMPRCIDANWNFKSGMIIDGDTALPPYQFISGFFQSLVDSRHKEPAEASRSQKN
jgi:translocation and assembly module TamB